MELGFLETEPGGLLVRQTTSDWIEWDGGLAGGLEPIWLLPPKPASRSLITCSRCKEPMTFILQVYAPIDDIPDAFHRDLCVFYCAKCPIDPLLSATCIRVQCPEENDFYPLEDAEDATTWPVPDRMTWKLLTNVESSNTRPFLNKKYALVVESEGDQPIVEEEDDEDEDAEEQSEQDKSSKPSNSNKGPAPCVICGTMTATRCSACQSRFYCSKEHQLEDWRKGHKQACKDLQDAKVTQKDLDAAAAMGDEQTARKLEEGRDKVFHRFLARTKAFPDQVLRYKRWPETENLELWTATDKRLLEAPPKCEHCGALRNFEMQLTPQFLSFFAKDLGVMETHKLDIDFGTIVIYTCTKSCEASKEIGATKEFAYCQPSSAKDGFM